jgi:hypothetical protein
MSAIHTFCSEWPYTAFFSVSQYTSDIIVPPSCTNSTIGTPFLSQKTAAISFLAGRRFFKLFQLVWWMGVRSFVWTFTNKTQVSSLVTRTMWLKNSSPSLWCHSKKVKAKVILCVLCAPVSIFRTNFGQNLWCPCLTVIILQRTVHKICENSHKSSEIVKCHL